ncbi:unnamed protein product [Hyaloperonospora brassicae]|uniref:Uncharacterized protein n=1 Tax=Hyaloperonospora brassicae TaxID=162125 RepID=A0AAV0TVS8_HYABA|nr:unnamed protein product [Hyaloperonospora brassicae]
MTGESGANRTFRSIFGRQERLFDEVLDLEVDGRASIGAEDPSAGASVAVFDGDKGTSGDNDDENEDTDAMWHEELLLECDVAAKSGGGPLGLQLAQQRSMEAWADEDDEEDNWKDALQDRVDQLELAFLPHDGEDAVAAEDRHGLDQQSVCQLQTHELRTWHTEGKVANGAAASTLVDDARMRSISIDCIARDVQTVEHYRKRSRSLSDTTDMMESPHHSLSRKNSFGGSGRSCISRSGSRDIRGIEAPLPSDAARSMSPSAAVSVLSDTEAIRRFVLDDVKSMSMERLVSDAQRLHFLEDFYQNQRRQGLALPAVISTAASAPPPVSPSPAVSTL